MDYVPACATSNTELPVEAAVDLFLSSKPKARYVNVLVIPDENYRGAFEDAEVERLRERAGSEEGQTVCEYVFYFDHTSGGAYPKMPVASVFVLEEKRGVPKPAVSVDFNYINTCGKEEYIKQ